MPIRGRFMWSCVTDFTTDFMQKATLEERHSSGSTLIKNLFAKLLPLAPRKSGSILCPGSARQPPANLLEPGLVARNGDWLRPVTPDTFSRSLSTPNSSGHHFFANCSNQRHFPEY
jgi:hypothetical protein